MLANCKYQIGYFSGQHLPIANSNNQQPIALSNVNRRARDLDPLDSVAIWISENLVGSTFYS